MSMVIPEAMLSDIIDYDELLSGIRREGMHVVMETSAEQVVEIVAESMPALLLAAVGCAPRAFKRSLPDLAFPKERLGTLAPPHTMSL